MPDVVHLFLHIPKAAGFTVHKIAERQYPAGTAFVVNSDEGRKIDDLAKWPRETRRSLCYVGGHFAYGFHEMFSRRCVYVTMLRDPADIMVSLYHYILRSPTHPVRRYLIGDKRTFLDFVSREWYGHIDNHQLRCLLGVFDRPATRDDLHAAKRLLVEGFAAVGLVEFFDASMLFFQDVLGWGAPYYRKRNVYREEGDSDVLTPEVREVLAKRHALSYELLAFARYLFMQRVRERGTAFQERLRLFREGNAAWSPP